MNSTLLLLDLCHKAGLMLGHGMKQIEENEGDYIIFNDGTKVTAQALYEMLETYIKENRED